LEWIASLAGNDGNDGNDGKSAYERAIELGVIEASISELEWISGLQESPIYIVNSAPIQGTTTYEMYSNILDEVNSLRRATAPTILDQINSLRRTTAPTIFEYNAVLDILSALALAGMSQITVTPTTPTTPIKSCHNPECVPKYKTLNTSTNDTSSTRAQNYSRFAKGNSARVCPINNTKNVNTGVVQTVVTSNRTKYIKRQYPMKIICTNNV
jgi:hypothetical protein